LMTARITFATTRLGATTCTLLDNFHRLNHTRALKPLIPCSTTFITMYLARQLSSARPYSRLDETLGLAHQPSSAQPYPTPSLARVHSHTSPPTGSDTNGLALDVAIHRSIPR
jgi:hypothetical protein